MRLGLGPTSRSRSNVAVFLYVYTSYTRGSVCPILQAVMLALAFFASATAAPQCGAATSTSIEIVCDATPATHLYEVSVGTNASSILTTPFSAVTSTRNTIVIADLKPGAAYYFKTRSHGTADQGGGTKEMITAWSNFSVATKCSIWFG